MCKKLIYLISFSLILGLVGNVSIVSADTIAYWRFDDVGDSDIDVPAGTVAPGNQMPDSDSQTVWRKAAHDHSGNGNHMTTWNAPGCGHAWSSDVPSDIVSLTGASNALSIVNTGGCPCVMTWSEQSNPSGIDIEGISPAAFTIEFSFRLDQLTVPEDFWLAHVTMLGRDGTGVVTSDSSLAPLNIGIWPGNTLIARFGDVAGFDHVAETGPDFVTTDRWYNLVVVSDGSTLSLYLDNEVVAQADLTASGSTNTAMAVGSGSGGDWEAGAWTIGRGLRNNHTDRFFGSIDEVRISDTALSPSEFLYPATSISKPNPENGAANVPRDMTISWQPGALADKHDVYLGTVYDDVSEAGRDNQLGVLFSQNQDANSYDPGRLEFSQTYYWRIDEVSAPPDLTIYKGNVRSFTIEPMAYPIPGGMITATASSQAPGQGPETTVNGSGLDLNGLHSTELTGMWLSEAGDPGSAWIQYDFDKVYKLHEMLVWNYNAASLLSMLSLEDVTIEYLADGANWTQLDGVSKFAQATGEESYAHNTTVNFSGQAVKSVKITANSNWAGGGGFFNQYGLSEVRFLYIPVLASEPRPDSGATDVALDLTLSWKAGREAAEHVVHLNTDEQTVIDGSAPIDTVNQSSYSPSPLDLESTYFWRVDEVNSAETPATWKGDIWSFSTQESIVVDDFESYNDIPAGEEGSNLVYETWTDGYTNPSTNGSTIGYVTGASMETDIVHGGNQSVPLIYDNSTASISEVTVNINDLAIGRDWTVGSLLVFWIHGKPGNNAATDQMYVKVNNATVIYDGDISRLQWKPIIVELASLGVDLSNVTQLTIGLERIGAIGGSGTVFIDDILLVSSAPAVASEDIWIEAEAAGSIEAPMMIYNDPNASGGQYIMKDPDAAESNNSPPADGLVTYTFTVAGGTYTIAGRVITSGNNDAFWVRIPGATTQTQNHSSGWVRWNGMTQEDVWGWEDIYSDDDAGDPTVEFTMPAGTYTLEIRYREDATLLDALVITSID